MIKEFKNRFVWAMALFVTVGAAAGCTPVKELDNNAKISSVNIEVTTPSAVLLGNPLVEGEEVTIPLIFGKYLFPIEIQLNINTAQDIDKILGLSPNKSLVFESILDINRVDLIALSGTVHSYTFLLEEVPSNEEANIEKFDIVSWSPESFLFVQTPHYDIINGSIEILGISEHFPFTILPQITLSQGAALPMGFSVENFTFSSYHTQFPLQLTAESGKVREWTIKLKQAQIISPIHAPNTDIRDRLMLQEQDITYSLLGLNDDEAVKYIEVDAELSTIRLFIQSGNWGAEWEASLSFPINHYTQIFDYKPENVFHIQGAGIQKTFFLVDMLDGYAVEWKIESVPWLSASADIESFDMYSYQSEFDIMELGTPIVYNMMSEVEIPVVKGLGFPLVIDAFQLNISSDAQIIDSLPEKLVFYGFDTKYLLSITAQNGEVKQWTIGLSDVRTGNSDAKVLSYTISSYSGTSQTEHNLLLNPQASIELQDGTVTIHILDWADRLPLKVEGHLEISPGALLFPFTFPLDHEIQFDTLEDRYTFTLISENGETEQTWHILLQNDAQPKSNSKEVIDFISGSPSIGFQFSEKYLEPAKKQITLMVSQRSAGFPLILAPRITVSPNARLLDIVSGAPLSLSFDQPKLFSVQAEDESVSEWRIVLIYAPQIPNSDFESWGPANNSYMNLLPANGTGWCTANNSTMSNTSPVVGYNSPHAVQMQTMLQSLNFVIFKVTTITAATAFLGKFTLKTGVNDVYNPMSMTDMGIPFMGTQVPLAFSIDYKYIQGAQLMFTEPVRGSLVPSFKNPVNIAGSDAANIRVELYYQPNGAFDYEKSRNDAVARGEIFIESSVPEWTHIKVPINVTPGKEGILPTHIVMVLTSSHEGDYFIGAPGSILTADNFNLIYYQPEEGAKQME